MLYSLCHFWIEVCQTCGRRKFRCLLQCVMLHVLNPVWVNMQKIVDITKKSA